MSSNDTQSVNQPTPVVLTIAGSDPCAGAGLQADLKTCSALGVYACTVVTAITAQNTLGVQSVWPVSAEQLRDQLNAIGGDIKLAAIKVGMLGDEALVSELIVWLETRKAQGFHCSVIIDPVLVSSSGKSLLSEAGCSLLKKKLLPFASLLTPNLAEAAVLLGVKAAQSDTEIQQQGQALLALGCEAVLIKGGHAEGDQCVDWLFTGDQRIEKFSSERIDTNSDHGTGCTLAAAIAACLAYQLPLGDAVAEAKQYLAGALLHSDQLRIGGLAAAENSSGEGFAKVSGPLHHFYRQWPSAAETDQEAH